MKVYRMAPSPTGHLHLGHAKGYLINYALAKADNAKFILRIEDTNLKKNKYETVDGMIRDCQWLGIEFDAGPEIGKKNEYFQSERFHIYHKYVQKLLDEGKAYKAYETPEEREEQIKNQRKKGQAAVYMGNHANLTKEEQEAFEKEGRKPIIRLHVPRNVDIKFKDEVYGEITINTNSIGDMPIEKSDGTPMYIFAVVVDDYEMDVTNIVRGQQHLSSIPKQKIIYKALGWDDKFPTFAHYSDLLNENAPGKLSKRHGAKPIGCYRAEGYLAEAIFNYLIVVSCSFKFQTKDDEIMTREQIYSQITPKKILKTNSKFSAQKLDWFNGQHIRRLSKDNLYDKVISWLKNDAKDLKIFNPDFDESVIDIFLDNKDLLKQALPLVHTRIEKFLDILTQLKFLLVKPNPVEIDITATKHNDVEFKAAAEKILNILEGLDSPFIQENWESKMREVADSIEWKHGDFFMALRLMVVGDRFSPPLLESLNLLGKEEVLSRIRSYISNV